MQINKHERCVLWLNGGLMEDKYRHHRVYKCHMYLATNGGPLRASQLIEGDDD